MIMINKSKRTHFHGIRISYNKLLKLNLLISNVETQRSQKCVWKSLVKQLQGTSSYFWQDREQQTVLYGFVQQLSIPKLDYQFQI